MLNRARVMESVNHKCHKMKRGLTFGAIENGVSIMKTSKRKNVKVRYKSMKVMKYFQ